MSQLPVFVVASVIGYVAIGASIQAADDPASAQPRLYRLQEIERMLADARQRQVLCGPVATVTALRFRGYEVDVERFKDLAGVTPRGTTIEGLLRAASQFDRTARAIQWDDTTRASELPVPSVLVVRRKHAVALVGRTRDAKKCLILDGTRRSVAVQDLGTIARDWTGAAIVFRAQEDPELVSLAVGLVAGSAALLIILWMPMRT